MTDKSVNENDDSVEKNEPESVKLEMELEAEADLIKTEEKQETLVELPDYYAASPKKPEGKQPRPIHLQTEEGVHIAPSLMKQLVAEIQSKVAKGVFKLKKVKRPHPEIALLLEQPWSKEDIQSERTKFVQTELLSEEDAQIKTDPEINPPEEGLSLETEKSAEELLSLKSLAQMELNRNAAENPEENDQNSDEGELQNTDQLEKLSGEPIDLDTENPEENELNSEDCELLNSEQPENISKEPMELATDYPEDTEPNSEKGTLWNSEQPENLSKEPIELATDYPEKTEPNYEEGALWNSEQPEILSEEPMEVATENPEENEPNSEEGAFWNSVQSDNLSKESVELATDYPEETEPNSEDCALWNSEQPEILSEEPMEVATENPEENEPNSEEGALWNSVQSDNLSKESVELATDYPEETEPNSEEGELWNSEQPKKVLEEPVELAAENPEENEQNSEEGELLSSEQPENGLTIELATENPEENEPNFEEGEVWNSDNLSEAPMNLEDMDAESPAWKFSEFSNTEGDNDIFGENSLQETIEDSQSCKYTFKNYIFNNRMESETDSFPYLQSYSDSTIYGLSEGTFIINRDLESCPSSSSYKTTSIRSATQSEEELRITASCLSDSYFLIDKIDQSGLINEGKKLLPPNQEFLPLLVPLIQDKKYFNVKVYIGKYRFRCQMCILQLYSPYFHRFELSETLIICLPEEHVTARAFHIIYKWMLTDKKTTHRGVSNRCLLEVFKTANFLDIIEISDAVSKTLDVNKSELEAFKLFKDLPYLDMPSYECLFNFRIGRYFLTIAASLEFMELTHEQVHRLLASNTVAVNSEIEIFYAAVRWLSHNWPSREKCLGHLMQCVRFFLLPPAFLRFLQGPQCTRIFFVITQRQDIKDRINTAFLYTSAELYCRDPTRKEHFSLPDFEVPEQRNWLYDRKCPYHLDEVCSQRQFFTYQQFLDYLQALQKTGPDYWQNLKLLLEDE